MSLDVYLYDDAREGECGPRQERIFVRRGGATVELTRDEWDAAYPGREPSVLLDEPDGAEVYTSNITHNLGKMAAEAELYEPLWQPETLGATLAGHLITYLERGLATLESDRPRFEQFNPKNGWGDYDLLIRFTRSYLRACEEYPEARIEVSR